MWSRLTTAVAPVVVLGTPDRHPGARRLEREISRGYEWAAMLKKLVHGLSDCERFHRKMPLAVPTWTSQRSNVDI